MKKIGLLISLYIIFGIQLKAQNIASYIFSQSLSTYTPITGGTVVDSSRTVSLGTSVDDINYTLSTGTIPFSFKFAGTNYTGLNINSNGYITFGATLPSTSLYSPISATTLFSGAVAVFSRDLNGAFNLANGHRGYIRYKTVGTSPNREFVIQWEDFKNYSTSATDYYTWDFQIRLSENGDVRTCYNNFSTFNGAPTLASSTVEIGLRGPNNTFATNVNNRLVTSGTNTYATSLKGISNASNCAWNRTTSLWPANNTVFKWSPPPAKDMEANAIISPVSGACYTNQVVVRSKNSGTDTLKFATDSLKLAFITTGPGATAYSKSVFSGFLAPNATRLDTLSTSFSTTSVGTYGFTFIANIKNGVLLKNDTLKATSNVISANLKPSSVDFNGFTGINLGSVFSGWSEASGLQPTGTTSNWSNMANFPTGNTAARINLFSNTEKDWLISPKIKADTGFTIKYKIALTNYTTITNKDSMGADDKLYVMVSNNCGFSWTPVDSIVKADKIGIALTQREKKIGSIFSGQDIIVGFFATTGAVDNTNDYFLYLDDIFVGSVPQVDMGVSKIILPPNCSSNSDSVFVTIKNFSNKTIDFALDSVVIKTRFVNPSGVVSLKNVTLKSGSLVKNAESTVFISKYNRSLANSYSYTAYTVQIDEGFNGNDTSKLTNVVDSAFTTLATNSFTGFNGSNLNTTNPFWNEGYGSTSPSILGTSLWETQTGLNGTGNITARINLYFNNRLEWIVTPKVKIGNLIGLKFKAAVSDWNSVTTSDIMGSDDSVSVYISTNCGSTWSKIKSITKADNLGLAFKNYLIDLSSYSGQNVIIGFKASDGSIDDNEDYDFHLDDISFEKIKPFDFSLTKKVSPNDVACLAGATSEPLKITLKYNSLATYTLPPDSFSVTTVISGPNTGYYTKIIKTGTFVSQAEQDILVSNFDFSKKGVYSGISYITYIKDSVLNNDTLRFSITNTVVSTFPFVENFDNWTLTPNAGTGGFLYKAEKDFNNATNDDYDWYCHTGATTSSLTGPDKDTISGSGKYLYLETSSITANKSAKLETPCIDISTLVNPHIKYYYHMYGATMGNLKLQILHNGILKTLDSFSGNKGNKWFESEIDLSNYKGVVTFVFNAISGTSFTGDLGIDAISVFDKPLNFKVNKIINPITGCYKTNAETVTINVKNVSNYKASIGEKITITYILNGTKVTQTETLTNFLNANDSINFTFTTKADLSSAGQYNLSVFAKNISDTFPLNDTLKSTLNSFSNAVLPIATGDFICAGNTAALKVTSNGHSTLQWFTDSLALTTPLITGNFYTTPSLSTTTKYFVRDLTVNGCVSKTIPIIADVKSLPTNPIVKDTSVCIGLGLSIFVAATDTLKWYNSITSTIPIFTGNTYTLPSGFASQTLYLVSNNNRCKSAIVPLNITVKALPATPVISSVDSICNGSNLMLTATGSSVSWYKGLMASSFISSGNNLTVNAVNTTETYTAFDKINGCLSLASTKLVKVNANPTDPIITVDSFCYFNNNVIFKSNKTVNWLVNNTSTILTTLDSVIRPNLKSNITMVAQAYNGFCYSNLISKTAFIKEEPKAVTKKYIACEGSSLILKADNLNTNKFNWSVLNNNVITPVALNVDSLAIIVNKFSQTYFIAPILNNCVGETKTIILEADSIPTLPVVQNTSFCQGQPLILTASSNFNIQWYDSTGSLITKGNTLFTGPITKTENYLVKTINNNCLSNAVNVKASFIATPPIPVVTAPQSICNGNNANLVSNLPNTQWFENTSSITPIQTSLNFVASELKANKVFYARSINATCTSPFVAVSVLVNPNPNAAFAKFVVGNLIRTEAFVNNQAFNYTWTIDDSTFNARNTAYRVINSNKKYKASLLVTNTITGCFASTTDSINVITANVKNTLFQNLTVYPIPFNTSLNLLYNATVNDNVSIQLYNSVGKLVFTQKVKVTTGVNTIQMSKIDIAPGTYVMHILGTNTKISTKVVKQ